jgi:molecular chaperone DnaJ
MPDALPDYYGILGVTHDATSDQIHAAFRHRAHECHPDLHPEDPDAVERFKQVNEAYHLLSNERQRRAYDAELTSLETRHVDVEVEVSIGLREIYEGCRIRLMVPRTTVCASCGGSGTVVLRGSARCPECAGSGWGPEEIFLGVRTRERCSRCFGRGRCPGAGTRSPCLPCHGLGGFLIPTPTDIRLPPGLQEGQRLRVPGQGQPLLNGGEGDLYVRVSVRPGPWSRREEDLVVDVPLPPRVLARGGRVPFHTPLESVELKIPRGSHYGEMLSLPGLGPPWPEGGSRGDLWVRLVPEADGRAR